MTLQNKLDSKSSHRFGGPTQTGKVPFTPPGTDEKCETAYWLWGRLGSKVVPLIVLHGGPGAPGKDFEALAPLYEEHSIPVLLYDQIGCGASTHLRSKRGDTHFWADDLFLAELDNLRHQLQIERFHLIGHSEGGRLALLYALKQPTGLRKLVIASSQSSDTLKLEAHANQREALPPDLADIALKCEQEGRMDSPEYQRASMMLMQRHFYRSEPWPPELLVSWELMQEDDTVMHSLYGDNVYKPTGPRKDFDVTDRLSEITKSTVPGGVLLTNGRYDMVPAEAMTPLFLHIRARIKWIQFAESAHFPHLEEREAYLIALSDFLKMV